MTESVRTDPVMVLSTSHDLPTFFGAHFWHATKALSPDAKKGRIKKIIIGR